MTEPEKNKQEKSFFHGPLVDRGVNSKREFIILPKSPCFTQKGVKWGHGFVWTHETKVVTSKLSLQDSKQTFLCCSHSGLGCVLFYINQIIYTTIFHHFNAISEYLFTYWSKQRPFEEEFILTQFWNLTLALWLHFTLEIFKHSFFCLVPPPASPVTHTKFWA